MSETFSKHPNENRNYLSKVIVFNSLSIDKFQFPKHDSIARKITFALIIPSSPRCFRPIEPFVHISFRFSRATNRFHIFRVKRIDKRCAKYRTPPREYIYCTDLDGLRMDGFRDCNCKVQTRDLFIPTPKQSLFEKKESWFLVGAKFSGSFWFDNPFDYPPN